MLIKFAKIYTIGFSLPLAHGLGANTLQQVNEEFCPEDMVQIGVYGDVFVKTGRLVLENAFDGVKDLFALSPHNVVNLETNLTELEDRAFPEMPFALKSPPALAQVLRAAGVVGVTRANNHAMDFGWKATQETSQYLEKADIKWAGVGKDSSSARKPFKITTSLGDIAFFSFNMTFPREAWAKSKRPGVAYPYPEVLEKAVRDSANRGERPVVIFHWGRESTTVLREYQPRVAKMAIDAGAYAVFGHHAHIAQGFELYKGKPISYGLGNLVFTSWSHHGAFSVGALLRMCSAHHRVQVLMVPLNTNPKETKFYTKPLGIMETQRLLKKYYKGSHFKDVRFYFPKEDWVVTIASLLKM